MAIYQYVNTQGGLSTVNANTSSEALANAQNRASDSGVQLLTTPQAPAPSQTPTINPVVANTPVNQTPPAITLQGLQNNTPVNVPTPPPTPQEQPTQSFAEKYIQQLTDSNAEKGEFQKFQESTIGKIFSNYANLEGESADRSAALQASGIQELKKQQKAINDQYNKLEFEKNQDDIILAQKLRAEERRDTLAPFAQMGQAKLAGDAAIYRALKTAEQGMLNAKSIALTGDIQLARDTVNDAIDAKYAPFKEKNAIYEAQLKALEPLLSREERKQAEKQKLRAEFAMKEIDKAELREKEIQKLIIDATSVAPSSVLANAQAIAKKGGSVIDVAQALGKYSGDYLGNQIKIASLAKTNKEIEKLGAEIKASTATIDTASLPATTNGFVTKLMASIKNSKDLDATERQSLSKARTVIGQLDSLQSNIAKQNKTGYIKGKVNNFKESFGLNADVGTINAQLQAIVPNLARGTYGEVGVLTDNDIANYRKTLPRLDRPQEQNDAVMALTLKTVLKSMENTLSGAANSNINVSGWTQDYLNIKNQINTIEDRIGVSKEAVNSLVQQDPSLAQAIKELYQNGFSDREILEALNAD